MEKNLRFNEDKCVVTIGTKKKRGNKDSAENKCNYVAETVAAKEGKIKEACIEVANIVNDWRTEIVGGLDADGAIKRKKMFFVRRSLAPSKVEKLVVLKGTAS